MQQLAQALELPIKAPSNDLRMMLEEKLRAMDSNPLNTQVQLHCTNKENNLLKQSFEEKEQELSVLKGVMDQDKALLEEICCENNTWNSV